MKIFDIYVAYVTWGSGGKKRPVLILEQKTSVVTVFTITTQYTTKSEAVRSKYYVINDWAQAGLYAQSYVNTEHTVTLPITALDAKPIGKLTKNDAQGLLAFLEG